MSKINAIESLSGALSRIGGLRGRLSTTELYAPYTGEHSVIPRAGKAQMLKTANKIVFADIVVLEVPYFETTNSENGTTVYIAREV